MKYVHFITFDKIEYIVFSSNTNFYDCLEDLISLLNLSPDVSAEFVSILDKNAFYIEN